MKKAASVLWLKMAEGMILSLTSQRESPSFSAFWRQAERIRMCVCPSLRSQAFSLLTLGGGLVWFQFHW